MTTIMVCCLSLYGGYGCTVRRRVFGVLRQSGQVAARAWTFAYRGRIETDGSTEFPQAGCALEEGRCSGYRSAVRRLFAYSQPYCRKVELTGKLPKNSTKTPTNFVRFLPKLPQNRTSLQETPQNFTPMEWCSSIGVFLFNFASSETEKTFRWCSLTCWYNPRKMKILNLVTQSEAKSLGHIYRYNHVDVSEILHCTSFRSGWQGVWNQKYL